MGTDIMLPILYPILSLTALVAAIIGFCGAILFISGGSTLEKTSAICNKTIFSIGPFIEQLDKSIIDLDSWVTKRSRSIGIVILIISIALFLEPHIHVM